VYAFYEGDRVRDVDLRDLPWLVKVAGKDNLRRVRDDGVSS